MAGMLDYSALFNVPGPGPQERGLSAIGDAISEVQQRKQRREELAAQLAAQRQQALMVDNRTREISEMDERGRAQRAEMLDARDRDKLAQESRFKLHEAVNKDVMPHLVAGHPDLANAVGAPLGIHATEQEAPPVGPAPVNPHPERFTPDLISMALAPNAQNMAHVKQMGDESNKFAADTTKNLAEQQAQDKALANPTYSIDGPGGFSQTYRSAEPREAAAKAGAAAEQAFAPTSTLDIEHKADTEVKAALTSGTIKPEDAAEYRLKIIEGQLNREERASRPRSEHHGLGDDRLELSKERDARAWAAQILSENNYKGSLSSLQKQSTLAASLGQKNAALDARAAGSFVKEAQGGSGVVSDNDMKVFWGRIGGGSVRSAEWVQGVIDGTIPSEKRKLVMDAVQWLAERAGGRIDEIAGAMDRGFRGSKNLSGYHDQMMNTYFPKWHAAAAASAKDAEIDSFLGGK